MTAERDHSLGYHLKVTIEVENTGEVLHEPLVLVIPANTAERAVQRVVTALRAAYPSA